MASIFARKRRLYAKLKVDGKWRQVPTDFQVGDERKAEAWAKKAQAEIDRRLEVAKEGPLTVRAYAEAWLAKRKTKTVADDRTRITLHVLPVIGDMLLVDVRPRHARDVILALRAAGRLAPRTIRQVSGVLHSMFKSAVIEELIATNPIVFEKGVLPKKIDKDPRWRHEAIYTRAEVEQLISDERIPRDRRVLYALKFLGALRHEEAASLIWPQWDPAARPLGAINLGLTKALVPRQVPVHQVLARILAAWKLSGWPELYGRMPGPDDLIVPTRNMTKRAPSGSQAQLIEDLELIGLRTRAGAERNRRGHDLRRTFITLARTDGALDSLLRWVTHGPKSGDMLDLYSTPPWPALCAEVAKLRIELRTGKLVSLEAAGALGAAVVQFEKP